MLAYKASLPGLMEDLPVPWFTCVNILLVRIEIQMFFWTQGDGFGFACKVCKSKRKEKDDSKKRKEKDDKRKNDSPE